METNMTEKITFPRTGNHIYLTKEIKGKKLLTKCKPCVVRKNLNVLSPVSDVNLASIVKVQKGIYKNNKLQFVFCCNNVDIFSHFDEKVFPK